MIETEYGVFHDRVDLDGNVIQTAEEVYKQWLENRNTVTNPSQEYIKSNKELQEENEKLKAQLEASSHNQEFLEECLMEMAQIVYA